MPTPRARPSIGRPLERGEPLFSVAGLPRASIHKELPTLAQGYDVVIIDGPPRVYDVARSAIMASDLVLIPVQPSPYDVWAAKEIVDLMNEASVFKPNLKSAFAINRKIVNTALGRDVVDALSDYPIPVLKAAICQRVVLAESAAQGQTVFETAPDHPAGKEVAQSRPRRSWRWPHEEDHHRRQADREEPHDHAR